MAIYTATGDVIAPDEVKPRLEFCRQIVSLMYRYPNIVVYGECNYGKTIFGQILREYLRSLAREAIFIYFPQLWPFPSKLRIVYYDEIPAGPASSTTVIVDEPDCFGCIPEFTATVIRAFKRLLGLGSHRVILAHCRPLMWSAGEIIQPLLDEVNPIWLPLEPYDRL